MNKNKNLLIILSFGIGFLVIVAALLFINNSKKIAASNNSNNTVPSIPSVTSESPTFLNTIWTANSIEGKNLIENSTITVKFDSEGKVTGTDGCNNFSSTYKINGTEIIIDKNMISTKKACNEEVMSQADNFTKLLLSSTGYKLGDGVMMLMQGEVAGLNFTGVTNSLSKTSWNVTGYNNGKEAVVGPIQNTNPTIVFGDDGTISGSAGCNTYSGTYSINGDSIAISTLAVTQRECIEPEGIMEQESSFITYLQKSNTWSIQGDQLHLRTAEDQLAVTAVKN